MRLNEAQVAAIRAAVASVVGAGAAIRLFGSRLDDSARGGDVDLLIEFDGAPSLLLRAKLVLALETTLGLPVDLLLRGRQLPPSPFEQIALGRGRVL